MSQTNTWSLTSEENIQKRLLGNIQQQKLFQKLSIRCSEKEVVEANAVLFCQNSKYLEEILKNAWLCPHATLDLVLPDFSSETVRKVCELLLTGETHVGTSEVNQVSDLIQTLFLTSLRELELKNSGNVSENEVSVSTIKASSSRLVNSESSSSITPDASYECKFCTKKFTLGIALKKHIRLKHPTEENKNNVDEFKGILCPKCDEMFRPKDIDNHVCVNNGQENNVSSSADVSVENLGKDSDIDPIERSDIQMDFFKDETLSSDDDSSNHHLSTECPDVLSPNKRSLSPLNPLPARKVSKLSLIKCRLCGVFTAGQDEMKIHIAESHRIDQIERQYLTQGNDCVVCKKNLVTRSDVIEHLVLEHDVLNRLEGAEDTSQETEISPEPQTPSRSRRFFRCNECSEVFGSHMKLVVHVTGNHFQDVVTNCYKDETCKLCQENFQNQQKLLLHLYTEHRILRNVIPDESTQKESPKAKKSIDLEIADVSSQKEAPPKIKKRKVENSIDAKSLEYYQCPHCPKQVSERRYSDLMYHLANSHFSDYLQKKHQLSNSRCKICHKNFSSKTKLLFHYVTCHDSLNGKIPDKESMKCTRNTQQRPEDKTTGQSTGRACHLKCLHCKKKFSSSWSVVRHLAEVHFIKELTKKFEGELTGKCPLCGKTFNKERYVFSHLAFNHEALRDCLPQEYYEQLAQHKGFSNSSEKKKDHDQTISKSQVLRKEGSSPLGKDQL